MSQGEIYLKFDSLESAAKAIAGLNGRFLYVSVACAVRLRQSLIFILSYNSGGQQITAAYIPDAMVDIHRK